jgi:hypothetical protein
MPADLIPAEAIPQLAAQVDTSAMLRALYRLQQHGFLLNGRDVDQETAGALERLAALGLVDPGYDGQTEGKPFLWVPNLNGQRVLRYTLESSVRMDPLARTALVSLSERDQLALLWTVASLANRAPDFWSREEVLRIDGEWPGYLVRATPDFRVFVRPRDSGGIELLDIIPEETLRLFLERVRAGSRAG